MSWRCNLSAMRLLVSHCQGTKDVLSEDAFIKVKVAEVFVEIAKRDWPDFWQAKVGMNDWIA